MRRLVSLAPGLAAGAIAIAIYSLGLFGGPERFFEDLLFSKRVVRNDVVIVAIDNKSLTAVGQWPWRRAVFGELLDDLKDAPPHAIGIDVIFAEESRYGAADDAALAAALRRAEMPVVVPVEASPLLLEKGFPEAGELVSTRSVFTGPNVERAEVNLITDPDGVVRRMPRGIKVRATDEYFKSFSETVAGTSGEPLNIERIAFVGPPGTIPRVSFIDALRDPDARQSLEDKYVLIGSTATDLHDEQLTPFSRGVPMAGVEIQAQLAHMFLNGDRIGALSRTAAVIWILLAALIPALLFMFVGSTRRAFAASVLASFVHVPAAILLFERGIIPNILHVNLAWILGVAAAFAFRYYVHEKERREMRHAFSKYVSKDVLEDILHDVSKVKLGGEERDVTVFFSDVRGFTTLSEKLTPVELTQFLNRYLTLMTDIALDRRGVVDKYIGDAIMVFWGAPLENPDHTLDTMEASLAMIEALHVFNKESADQGDPAIDIGIGFNSGKVVVGNMGSEQRFDYTVMGDTVNLASRLEGQTKTYGVHIIASEYSIARIPSEELAKRGIVIREIDRIRVKGKKLPVTIFEVVERKDTERVRAILQDFDALRVAYYKGEWQKAINVGKMILAKTADGPTKVLLERAEHFLHEPPAEWEGVYEMKTK